MWITDHNAFVLRNIFSDSDFLDLGTVTQEIGIICKSNYSRFTVYLWKDPEVKDTITAYVFNSQEAVEIKVGGELVSVKNNDVLLIVDDSDTAIPSGIVKHRMEFSFSKKKELFGNGSKVFDVTAKISDEYRIKVLADSEEDAVEQARDIPIYEWEHPDIEPHLTERMIIRMARWGNIVAKETN